MSRKVAWQPKAQHVVREDTRPWPVNPAEYPLTGKTRGPVYCPPLANNPYRDIVIWGGVCLAMWAAIICAAYWFAR